MGKLSITEQSIISKLFNNRGYVLNFSTYKFDDFTESLIGLRLTEKYNLSKGASLDCYIREAEASEAVKLVESLLEYALANDDFFEVKNVNAVKKCREIIAKYKGLKSTVQITTGFSSEYLSKMTTLMFESIEKNPTEAIGKAKELVESCCKTILDSLGVIYSKTAELSQLIDSTLERLKLLPKNIPDTAKESTAIKALLGNLRAISANMCTLRNAYGSGHGKTAKFHGLETRHAKLAVGSSVTLVNFLWDTFEEQQKEP